MEGGALLGLLNKGGMGGLRVKSDCKNGRRFKIVFFKEVPPGGSTCAKKKTRRRKKRVKAEDRGDPWVKE